jgi:type IV pilus assembly protein PilA
MLQKSNINSRGFTLIELMIVITIVGLLSAIAIPNFIAYRDKGYCSAAESDANSIANAMGEYFALPIVQSCSKAALLGANAAGKVYARETFTNLNTWDVDTTDLNNIAITVNDFSSRCPSDYRAAMSSDFSPRGYWSGFTYVKLVKN